MDSENSPAESLQVLTPISDTEGTQDVEPNRLIVRSCHDCHKKKVRCDKKDPCSSCVRAGKPCVYPLQGPRIRRAKKTIMADMAARIRSLEESLRKSRQTETSALEIRNSAPTTKLSAPVAPVTVTDSRHRIETPRDDVLVENGSSSQYFSEVFLSRVIREERDIKCTLSQPQAATPRPSIPSPFNALGLFSSPDLSRSPSRFHPPKPLAIKLWKIYVDIVDTCPGSKRLHIPTDELRVYSVISDPARASFEDLALCFAVYFASSVTLDDSETSITLGQDKHSLLSSFKAGLEQAFAHADFLDQPTFTGLCALAIYLSALRVHNHGKSIWILNGLAIRIAQSLGLHRDGKQLGLSTFQAEIRRRLWWHLIAQDSRAGEDYGLENANGLLVQSEVELPLNLDDTDLFPDMKELPVERTSWTPMTCSLVNIDLTKTLQRLAAISESATPFTRPGEEVRAEIMMEAKSRVQKRLRGCSSVLPQQLLTLSCCEFILRKFDFITRLQWASSQPSNSPVDFATEENFVEALEILGPRLSAQDDILYQYAWARKAYPQYTVIMYILWHLCVHPESPNVERAWAAVDTIFSCEIFAESAVGFGGKSAVLVALKVKALSSRAKFLGQDAGDRVTGNDKIGEMLEKGFRDDVGILQDHLGDMSGDMLTFDIDLEEWPDWLNPMHGFQLNFHGAS